MELSQERPPLALIACSDDWMSRALESVFQQHGYVVAHTRSGVQTMELVRLDAGAELAREGSQEAFLLLIVTGVIDAALVEGGRSILVSGGTRGMGAADPR